MKITRSITTNAPSTRERSRGDAAPPDHERDGRGADQRVGDEPRLELPVDVRRGQADPQPAQQARAPAQPDHDDGDHGERGQHAEDRLQVDPAHEADPEEPPALLGERVVGPVREENGEREIGHEDVPALQPLIAEERQMDEQMPERRPAAEREEHPDQRYHVPHQPLGGPAPQPYAAQEHGRGHERQDADVVGHFGQVVGRKETGLAERSGPAQQVRHQHQQQPLGG